MIDQKMLPDVMGSTMHDSQGEKVGKVGQIYLDDTTGEPNWATVSTGMFGSKESFVPISDASFDGDVLSVSVTKDAIKDAPKVETDGHLEPHEETELYRHYNLDSGAATTTPTTNTTTDRIDDRGDDRNHDRNDDRRDRAGEAGVVGQDTSGPTTDDAMTRSEERLDVGTETVQTGRARLRKFIVTENVTQTVPVSREEVRVVREPITDANRGDAMSGGDLTEEEHEVTLSEERVVANKETVPVERVRLDKETVTGEQQVTEEVRKEQIETVDGTGDRGDTRS